MRQGQLLQCAEELQQGARGTPGLCLSSGQRPAGGAQGTGTGMPGTNGNARQEWERQARTGMPGKDSTAASAPCMGSAHLEDWAEKVQGKRPALHGRIFV